MSQANCKTAYAINSILGILILIAFNGCLWQVNASKDDRHYASKWAISRKSIVFDLKTPKVFYCPQSKQADESKMIVKSVPLERLCEFDGKPKPKGSQSDCYNDVDESQFACDEKKRFMLRLDAIDEGVQGSAGSATTTTDGLITGPVSSETELEFLIPHKLTSSEKKSLKQKYDS